MSDANKQLMRDMFAALSAGDADGFLRSLADDAQLTIHGTTKYSGLYNGRADAAERLLGGLSGQLDGGLTVFDDLDGKVVEIIEYLDTDLVTTILGR